MTKISGICAIFRQLPDAEAVNIAVPLSALGANTMFFDCSTR
jgi:uncharacterized ferredoxin-like protein